MVEVRFSLEGEVRFSDYACNAFEARRKAVEWTKKSSRWEAVVFFKHSRERYVNGSRLEKK